MSLPPKSKVIGVKVVKRLCGCDGEFEELAGDRFSAQRLAKFKESRCPTCAARRAEEQAKLMIPKGEAYAALPVGTQVALVCEAEGAWAAKLTAADRTVEARSTNPQAAMLAAARLWGAGG